MRFSWRWRRSFVASKNHGMPTSAPLVAVSGTGTGIGKTFLSVAFVRAWASRGLRVVGYKPIESGVAVVTETDAHVLSAASTFHVKHLPLIRLRAPVSPHLAAELEGVQVDLDAVADEIAALRFDADGVVVELPGGLFTPLTEHGLVIDLVALIRPTALILVAPDRLGCLHDILSALKAKSAHPQAAPIPTHVLFNAPEKSDASTGTNAKELARFVKTEVFGPVERATPGNEEEVLQPIQRLLSRLDPSRPRV